MPGIFEPKVVTTEGPVLGVRDGEIFVFKGIPYAKPPIGNLRWRPPEKVKHWTDPLQANERGASSFQNAELCADIGGGDPTPPPLSEDCLYLNVWTPNLKDKDQTALLPVMVWIHGGGYVIGAGGLPPYVGTPLAKRGAVVVSINYRLGHLGFFAHPALDKESTDKGEPVVNNFALLDQIAALEWVQRNISHFGGDPGHVTIFGQSAGGRSVLSLFASPVATEKKLFHKGVAQSVYGLPDVPRETALQRGQAFAAYFKKDKSSKDMTAAELRKLDPDRFWRLKSNSEDPLEKAAAFGEPVPISGDAVLPEPMLDVFEEGEQAKLPLIIGNNSDDASVLDDFGLSPLFIIEILKNTPNPKQPPIPPTLYGAVKLLYLDVIKDEELGRQIGRDLLFTTMSFVIAKRHERAGAAAWRYYFDYVAQEKRTDQPKGARHGDEVSYVLDTGNIAPPTDEYFSEEDEAFAQKVSDYWLEFVHSASNDSESIAGGPMPEWHKHKPTNEQGQPPNKTMGFGKTPGVIQPSNTIKEEDNFMFGRVIAFEETLKNLGTLIGMQEERIHSFETVSEEEPKKKTA